MTLGGDRLVDLAPVAYLGERYGDELAVLWVDTHPDVAGRGQQPSTNAHVLAMLLGAGDPDFVAAVTRPVAADRVLQLGLTDPTPFEATFIAEHGLAPLGPDELASSAGPVLSWLRNSEATKVAVHFALDVLDPGRHDFLLFNDPAAGPDAFAGIATSRMRLSRVSEILGAVAAEAEIVELAVTEYFPWDVIKLAGVLGGLPLLGGPGPVTSG